MYKQHNISKNQWVNQILNGKIVFLSKAITLSESKLENDQDLANQIIQECMKYSGNSIRIGISGSPGSGKSTFIESFGLYLLSKGHKIAILAVDPSSTRTGGSILGDKTRMNEISKHPNVFIRPSPSKSTLGGVSVKTQEILYLCEAAGFDIIIIETVGVGQSEIDVNSMVDFFLVLVLAGAGDELQGIKRGIMEIADHIVISKADGKNLQNAKNAVTEYNSALSLFTNDDFGWKPKASICSAINQSGISEIWDRIMQYKSFMIENMQWQNKRNQQKFYWFKHTIEQKLMTDFYSDSEIQQKIPILRDQIMQNQGFPPYLAFELVNQFLRKK